jgi:DNA-binding NarL/FixJ family response regulator
MTARTKALIFVVEQSTPVRDGLEAIVNRQPDMACCGASGTYADARLRLGKLQPDLVALDLRANPGDGIEFTKDLLAQCSRLRILAISPSEEAIYAERALRAGARGFVSKTQPVDDVLCAIRSILAGEVYVGKALERLLLNRVIGDSRGEPRNDLENLTDRELHVFQLLGGGLTTREIARHLNLSGKTVETHRSRLQRKIGVSGAAELVRSASEWRRKQPAPGFAMVART